MAQGQAHDKPFDNQGQYFRMVFQGHEQGKLLFGLVTIIFPLASPALGKWYPLGRVGICHQMEVQDENLHSG